MTITNIDAAFDSIATSAAQDETSASLTLSTDAGAVVNIRGQLRFPLGAITAGSTINDSVLQFNVQSTNVEAGEGIDVHAYNATGDDDPDLDAAATKFSRSIGGSALVLIDTSSIGSKTGDLTATADAQIAGNLSSPGFYSLGLNPNGFDASESITVEAIESAGTDPATLIVDWTAGGGTVVPVFFHHQAERWRKG